MKLLLEPQQSFSTFDLKSVDYLSHSLSQLEWLAWMDKPAPFLYGEAPRKSWLLITAASELEISQTTFVFITEPKLNYAGKHTVGGLNSSRSRSTSHCHTVTLSSGKRNTVDR